MSDPTLTLIDSFTGVDAGPLPSPWAAQPLISGTGTSLSRLSNACKLNSGTDASAYRDVTAYGANIGAFATLVAWTDGTSDGSFEVFFYLQGSGLGSGTPDGYSVVARIRASATDTLRICKYTGGSQSVIASITEDAVAGDVIGGIKDDATNIITYWRYRSGTWSPRFTFTDSSSPFNGGGKIGLGISDIAFSDAMIMDDLSTGLIATATVDTPQWPQRALLRW